MSYLEGGQDGSKKEAKHYQIELCHHLFLHPSYLVSGQPMRVSLFTHSLSASFASSYVPQLRSSSCTLNSLALFRGL
jgi:hypothetical protein